MHQPSPPDIKTTPAGKNPLQENSASFLHLIGFLRKVPNIKIDRQTSIPS